MTRRCILAGLLGGAVGSLLALFAVYWTAERGALGLPGQDEEGPGVRFEVSTDYLSPIELGDFQHVTIRLTGSRTVTVFDDAIYVATEADVAGHKDGRKIWQAAPADQHPYGKVLPDN